MYLLVLAACLSLSSAAKLPLDFNCTGLPNGLAWWGCRAYGVCNNDEHEQTDCVNGTAYDQNSGICVDETQAAFPCNRQIDCSSLNGTVHRVPEMETIGNGVPCQFYYTCNYGIFVGHQMCGEGLVYSENFQNCLPPEFVEPPCGIFESNNNNNNFNNNNNNNFNNNNNNNFNNNNNNNNFNNNNNNFNG